MFELIVGILVLFRFIFLAEDSKGEPSFSLTGIQTTALLIFLVILIDSRNDRITPPSPPALSSPASKTPKGSVRRPRRPRRNTLPVRLVVKEKYFLLGMMFLSFCALYIIGHKSKDRREWTLKGIMAVRKMDPYLHVIDSELLAILKKDPFNPEVQDFFVRAILAKHGHATGSRGNEDPTDPEQTPDIVIPHT